MKTFKRILALITAMIMLVSFAACGDTGSGGEAEESTTSYIREVKTKIASLNGVSGMSLAKLMADRDYAYEVTSYSDPQEIADLIKNGETDIALLPVNTAASLYKETNGAIKILAVNAVSTLYVLEKGNSVKSIDDLKGKTVYAAGKGTAAEYIINRLFSDVKVEYKNDYYNEITSLINEGKADFCILPEPIAASVIASGK
ncbi:MAG: ABC transporter substrate-binding protein, partial [bacterium]|nr:ABC transporter substrate-binding protein [bacterium]